MPRTLLPFSFLLVPWCPFARQKEPGDQLAVVDAMSPDSRFPWTYDNEMHQFRVPRAPGDSSDASAVSVSAQLSVFPSVDFFVQSRQRSRMFVSVLPSCFPSGFQDLRWDNEYLSAFVFVSVIVYWLMPLYCILPFTCQLLQALQILCRPRYMDLGNS